MGVSQQVKIKPGTVAHQIYQNEAVTEQFRCNYGLNPHYRAEMSRSELRVAGVDLEDEVRMVELPRHRFFVATLFLPQLSSTPETPHPLILAYLQAALAAAQEQEETGFHGQE